MKISEGNSELEIMVSPMTTDKRLSYWNPTLFEYTHRSPDGIETTTTQMLFGDLIAAVEHATDQEESGDAKPTRAPDFKPGTNAQRHSLHRSKHGHGSEHDSGTESLGRMRVANLFGLSTRGRSDSDSLRLPS